MLSLLQNIQRQVGKAASGIAAPSLRELPLEQLSEPTVGWLPEDDYSLRPPQIDAVNLSPVSSPAQTSPALLSVPRTVAFPFQVEPIAHSPLALLGEADTEELRAKLQASTAPNRIRRLTKPQSVSDNLNRRLGTSRRLRTEDCLALLLARFVVSEDLHKPLARSARADGKRYAAEAQSPEKAAGLDKLQTPPLAFGGAGLGNRKAFEQARGGGSQRVKRGMSIWDLLLPLLQRPVNLDLGTVVDLPSNLYPYQITGVDFLAATQSALLGDDMGTGKTAQEKAVCDECLLLFIPSRNTVDYQLLIAPRQNENNEWVQMDAPEFRFLREFVDAFLRPEKYPNLKPFVTKTPRSIDSILKIMDSMVPRIPDASNDPAFAASVEAIEHKIKRTEEEISRERTILSVVRKSNKHANHTRTLHELEHRLVALDEERSRLMKGDDPDLAEIQTHAIKRLKRDFILWDKGLLEVELSMPVHRVYWELLKPTGDSWEELIRHFRYLENSRNEQYDVNRLKCLYDFKPDTIYVGRASFEGYVVFCYKRGETAALECPRVGNAFYLMKLDEWKFLSQQSKTQLLSQHRQDVERIIHSGDYEYEIKRRLTNRGVD